MNISLVQFSSSPINHCNSELKSQPKSPSMTSDFVTATAKDNIYYALSTGKLLTPPLTTFEWFPTSLPMSLFQRRIHSKIINGRLGLNFTTLTTICWNILQVGYQLNWIDLSNNIISRPKKKGIQNHIRNTTWRSISKYHRLIRQSASIYLDYLIATASWVFSPRVFPRP